MRAKPEMRDAGRSEKIIFSGEIAKKFSDALTATRSQRGCEMCAAHCLAIAAHVHVHCLALRRHRLDERL